VHPLPDRPRIPAPLQRQIEADFGRFRSGLPSPLEPYCLESYGIDLASVYAGLPIKNPFGKASGQLSLARHQVEKDAEAGLGFVVLKTVIAQNEAGLASMQDWAIRETHMVVERITGRSGRSGWTVTWKGRGWHESFASYLDFFGAALDAAAASAMLVVPSCKYHLPRPGESRWRTDEYAFTTAALADVWRGRRRDPMPLEKDFSPTLAGSDLATQQETILEWLRRVPGLVRDGAGGAEVRIGLKIFNAMFDDAFQLEMLRVAHAPGREPADFFVYANRLFDPDKVFEGKVGVAYGGPDLSERNLRILRAWRALEARGERAGAPLPLSATGDIGSGRTAVEYLLRGASSFQIHTFFQLPDSEYAMPSGGRTERALHRLYFDPIDGFIPWICHLREAFGWREGMTIGEMARFCADPSSGVWSSAPAPARRQG
jgi:hypothetical protein